MGPSQSVTVRHLPGPVPAERAREGEMGKSDGENDSMFATMMQICKKGTNENTFCRKRRHQTYPECPENNDKIKISEGKHHRRLGYYSKLPNFLFFFSSREISLLCHILPERKILGEFCADAARDEDVMHTTATSN